MLYEIINIYFQVEDLYMRTCRSPNPDTASTAYVVEFNAQSSSCAQDTPLSKCSYKVIAGTLYCLHLRRQEVGTETSHAGLQCVERSSEKSDATELL